MEAPARLTEPTADITDEAVAVDNAQLMSTAKPPPMPPPPLADAPPIPLPASVPAPHFLEDCVRWTPPGCPWSLQGHSIAGERTGFWMPEAKIGFDAGLPTDKRISCVFITHSHSDHTFYVPWTGAMNGKVGLVVPAPMEMPLRHLCRASISLNYGVWPPLERDLLNIRAVVHGDVIDVVNEGGHKTNIRVRVVDCTHGVPCVGYIVCTATSRLREEYRALAGKEIAELRRRGEAVMEDVVTPRLAFLGDTTVDVFADDCASAADILRCPVVVVECTLLGTTPADGATARERGHTSWGDLQPVVRAHPGTTFVLIHFSQVLLVCQHALSASALSAGRSHRLSRAHRLATVTTQMRLLLMSVLLFPM